ncbi:hypothetical protein EJ03DRAFT_382228 [Teratosphaeria nubilosa]|uniref:Uncharacterized protein n=1 Tax=Teratosphaeria nubilosa TaxID=161662 RepID=A0A6G1LB72_9PEZI|nr:hypothetical protein EJ03DRAFT_382228 [Teratosphaeria nubilosa]
MSTHRATLTGHPIVSLPAHAAVQSDCSTGFTSNDYYEPLTPPGETADVVPLLEELAQLCLLVSKRRVSNSSIALEHPHLEDYRSWIVAQARSVIVSLASRHKSLDNETIKSRIKAVVAQLAETKAAPAAKVTYEICRDMEYLLSGHDRRSMVSDTAVKDLETTSANLELRTLDFCGDSDKQTFEGHQCDLIIASSTIRMTETSQILDYLQRSLRADGQLTFQRTDAFDWITYVFGMRPEWWFRKHDESRGTPTSSGLNGRIVAAVGMGKASGHAVDSKFKDHLTVFLVASELLPDRLTSNKTVAARDDSLSTIVESIIRHLGEDGYHVTRCASESQTQLGQEVISVEMVDHGLSIRRRLQLNECASKGTSGRSYSAQTGHVKF